MTISDFQDLQKRAASSGMTLKSFLQAEVVAYPTYNYWCRKMKAESEALPTAPISIRRESRDISRVGTVPGIGCPGVMLAFLNTMSPRKAIRWSGATWW